MLRFRPPVFTKICHEPYLVRDEDELKGLFSEFECLSVGYFDQKMFDLLSNFHWIFIGKKRS